MKIVRIAGSSFLNNLPFWAPPRSFEHYPAENVVMPPMPENDLDDVGKIANRMAHTEYFIYRNVINKPQ